MIEPEDLEPNQYQRLYWEEDAPVKDVRKNALRKFVYLGTALCLVFIAMGLWLRFPDEVELPFVLKSDKAADIYRFPAPVYVTDRYSTAGGIVKAGQPIIKITSPEIVALINSYHEAEQKLANFTLQKRFSVQKQKALLEKRGAQTKNQLDELQKEMLVLDSTWKSNLERLEYENTAAIKKYDANKGLFDKGLISRFEFNDFEAQKIRDADSLLSSKQNYERLKLSLGSLSARYLLDMGSISDEVDKLIIDNRYDSISLCNQFELVKNKIVNSYGNFEIKNGALILKAGKNGVVSYIFDGEKEVPAGAILLNVIFNDPSFYAFIKSPPGLVGKITKSEKTVLKIASFPFYEWGTVKGTVDNVSLTPDENGNFSVKITISDFGKLEHLLQTGMNGNAVIILEEKTFFDYFFRKTKRIYSRLSMT